MSSKKLLLESNMFTNTDEPLTFVAHGDLEVMRVCKTTSKERMWLVELFSPVGMISLCISNEAAQDLARMIQSIHSE